MGEFRSNDVSPASSLLRLRQHGRSRWVRGKLPMELGEVHVVGVEYRIIRTHVLEVCVLGTERGVVQVRGARVVRGGRIHTIATGLKVQTCEVLVVFVGSESSPLH